MHLHQPPSTFNHLGEKARRKDAKIIKNLYTKHYKVSHQVLKLITVVVVGGWVLGGWGLGDDFISHPHREEIENLHRSDRNRQRLLKWR